MKYIIYLLIVTMATMILIYVGYLKEKTLPADLTNKLYRNCCKKVLRFLKKREYATETELQNCIRGVNAWILWSRRRITVTNPVQFCQYVINGLEKGGKISASYRKNMKIYCISKK